MTTTLELRGHLLDPGGGLEKIAGGMAGSNFQMGGGVH